MLSLTRRRLIVLSVFIALVALAGLKAGTGSRAQKSDNKAMLGGPLITATMTAAPVTDVGTNGAFVNPGDTLEYTVTINNTGDPATGVVFSDNLTDANLTLVPGSIKASPIAFDETYSVTGNVRIQKSEGTLLANDIRPTTGTNTGLTITAIGTDVSAPFSFNTTNGGTVTAATGDGSFEYDPPAGFEGTGVAADSFTYTITDPDGLTGTGTVRLDVSGMIWFVNNSAAACVSRTTGCGRLTTPYSSLANFQAENNGTGNNPAINDNIFLFNTGTSYTGGVTLLNGQKLIGTGANAALATVAGITLAANSDALPPTGGVHPVITNVAGAGVTLGSGNTLNGFDVGDTSTVDITGSSFGTLTVAAVALNGTGRALNLGTGTLAATFDSIVSTSSTAGVGVNLFTVGGTMTSTGGVSIAGGAGAIQCILVQQSSANVNFGNTTCTGGTDGLFFQSNTGGTRTFGTVSATGGSAFAFFHNTGGGNVTVTGAATLSSANSAVRVNAPGATNVINFQAATTATSTVAANTGVDWIGTAGAAITFNSLSVQTNAGTGISATTGGTFNVTNGTGTVNNTTQAAPAIVANAVALNANFASINSSGGTNGVSLTNVSGISNFGNGTLTGTATGPTFLVSGGTATTIFNGNVSQANAAELIRITGGHNSGTVQFDTGTLSATNGTGLLFDNADGNYTFNGTTTLNGGDAGIDIVNGSGGQFSFGSGTTITNPSGIAYREDTSTANVNINGTISKTNNAANAVSINAKSGGLTGFNDGVTATTTTANAINLTSNTGGSITFGGGLALNTTSGIGFNATGGGTVIAAQAPPITVNTIASTTGTALNVANTTIGAGGLTFRSISKNGGTNNAIVLNTTGSGGLTVTGNSTAASGGTLQNISNADAVSLNNTSGLVSLNRMVIQDITASTDATDALQTHSGVDAIHGKAVNGGLTLTNSTIQRISDNAINGTVDGVPVTNNPTFTTWNGLTLTNSTIQNTNRFNVANKGDATNESAIIIWGIKGTVSVNGNTFQNCSSGIDFYTDTSGTLDMTVQSNTFDTLYKEIGTNSVGRFGISVVQRGSATSTVRVGDWQNETNAALGNTFINGGNIVGVRVISDTDASGNLKTEISKNTFTVTDHSSPGQTPGNTIYNFPQSGVLLGHAGNPLFPAAGGNYEGIVAANTFNECMHADGGLGNVTINMAKGDGEAIVRNNTFNKPWDLPMEIRADGQSNTQTSSKILVTGNTHIDGIVGDGTTDLGGQSPYGSSYVQVRNNGRMDLTMQNEATPLGLTDTSSATGTVSLFTQTTTAGDILNIFLNNIQGPRGYRLKHDGFGTYNLFRNGSASGTAQGVLQDNIVRGGGGVDTTNPPAVTATGTINLTNIAPQLPNITQSRPTVFERTVMPEHTESKSDGEIVAMTTGWELAQADASVEPITLAVWQQATTEVIPATTERATAPASDGTFGAIATLVDKMTSQISPTVYSQATEKEAPEAGTVTVNGAGSGFTLPTNKSTTITFRATISNPTAPVNTFSVSNQGSVSGTGFTTVQTDDPGVAGAANPTVTTVVQPPTITKTFTPANILLDQQSTLTITINNTNPAQAVTGITVTDTFPANVVVASPLTAATTCGAGTLQNNTGGVLAVGDPGIKLVGGTRAAAQSCTVTVKVRGTIGGTYPNTTGNVASFEGFTGTTASSTLNVSVLTASELSISGRVLTAEGRGIRNARVTITGNSLASPITVSTGVNGTYQVNGLAAGETYIVTVGARRFVFEQPSRVVTLIDNVTDADFVGSAGTSREQ